MVKQFAKCGAAVNAPRLLAVDRIQSLIDKQPGSTQHVTPPRALHTPAENESGLAGFYHQWYHR